jgi:hypothetical protein
MITSTLSCRVCDNLPDGEIKGWPKMIYMKTERNQQNFMLRN